MKKAGKLRHFFEKLALWHHVFRIFFRLSRRDMLHLSKESILITICCIKKGNKTFFQMTFVICAFARCSRVAEYVSDWQKCRLSRRTIFRIMLNCIFLTSHNIEIVTFYQHKNLNQVTIVIIQQVVNIASWCFSAHVLVERIAVF